MRMTLLLPDGASGCPFNMNTRVRARTHAPIHASIPACPHTRTTGIVLTGRAGYHTVALHCRPVALLPLHCTTALLLRHGMSRLLDCRSDCSHIVLIYIMTVYTG